MNLSYRYLSASLTVILLSGCKGGDPHNKEPNSLQAIANTNDSNSLGFYAVGQKFPQEVISRFEDYSERKPIKAARDLLGFPMMALIECPNLTELSEIEAASHAGNLEYDRTEGKLIVPGGSTTCHILGGSFVTPPIMSQLRAILAHYDKKGVSEEDKKSAEHHALLAHTFYYAMQSIHDDMRSGFDQLALICEAWTECKTEELLSPNDPFFSDVVEKGGIEGLSNITQKFFTRVNADDDLTYYKPKENKYDEIREMLETTISDHGIKHAAMTAPLSPHQLLFNIVASTQPIIAELKETGLEEDQKKLINLLSENPIDHPEEPHPGIELLSAGTGVAPAYSHSYSIDEGGLSLFLGILRHIDKLAPLIEPDDKKGQFIFQAAKGFSDHFLEENRAQKLLQKKAHENALKLTNYGANCNVTNNQIFEHSPTFKRDGIVQRDWQKFKDALHAVCEPNHGGVTVVPDRDLPSGQTKSQQQANVGAPSPPALFSGAPQKKIFGIRVRPVIQKGWRITSILPDGHAKDMGLQQDDVITGIESNQSHTHLPDVSPEYFKFKDVKATLLRLLTPQPHGQITVERNGTTITLDVALTGEKKNLIKAEEGVENGDFRSALSQIKANIASGTAGAHTLQNLRKLAERAFNAIDYSVAYEAMSLVEDSRDATASDYERLSFYALVAGEISSAESYLKKALGQLAPGNWGRDIRSLHSAYIRSRGFRDRIDEIIVKHSSPTIIAYSIVTLNYPIDEIGVGGLKAYLEEIDPQIAAKMWDRYTATSGQYNQ